MNTFIRLLNLFINFIISLVPIPMFITPPKGIKLWGLHKDWYFFDVTYNGEQLDAGYLSHRKRVLYNLDQFKVWGFNELVRIPYIKKTPAMVRPTGLQIVTDRRTQEVWDYTDALGKKMKVTYTQRKQLEKDRFYTSNSEKKKLVDAGFERIIERENTQSKALTGKYIHN